MTAPPRTALTPAGVSFLELLVSEKQGKCTEEEEAGSFMFDEEIPSQRTQENKAATFQRLWIP